MSTADDAARSAKTLAAVERVMIPDMDFWHVAAGGISDNPVSIDVASVQVQLGVDGLDGKGREAFDRGAKTTANLETV